jgi:hypothetical protein
MWSRILIVAVAGMIGPLGLIAAEGDSETDSSAALPKDYAGKYLLAANTLSPDKKVGVIYPKADLCEDGSEKECKDFLVQLEPFKILATLETKSPHFQNRNHGGIHADWASDKSAMLVTLESKWGPGEIFLFEFKDGQMARSTNLLRKIQDLLEPDYRKAMSARSNDEFGFVFQGGDEPIVELKGSTVQINASATTDPKHIPGVKAWDGRVEAVWDIPLAKFTSQKVERLFAGIRKDG